MLQKESQSRSSLFIDRKLFAKLPLLAGLLQAASHY